MISHKEFVELVRQMRYTQMEYFKTKDLNVLEKSKELESKVDMYIAFTKDGFDFWLEKNG
jgi:hypothetical protein